MWNYSRRSELHKQTCDDRLQFILDELIKLMDVKVHCGHRGEVDQNEAFDKKYSKLKYPRSRHNSLPSRAVDVAPYPTDWENRERFMYMQGLIRGIAAANDIKLRKLIKWDLPHVALEDE